jgi:hypothetical protein
MLLRRENNPEIVLNQYENHCGCHDRPDGDQARVFIGVN